MSTAADRRLRGARNRLADLVGLGRPLPLVDLPVLVIPGTVAADDPAPPTPPGQPVIVPFGGAATVVVTEAEPEVAYRVRGIGDAAAAMPVAEARGEGGRLAIVVPRIDRSVVLAVDATTRHGHQATLLATVEVKVGLDRAIPVAVTGFDARSAGDPVLVDYGTRVRLVTARSQEAVSYSLLLRPPGDTGPDDRLQAVAGDRVPAGRAGDGGPVELVSEPLTEDGVLRVRADRGYGGDRRQATLLEAQLVVHVRADRARRVSIAPAVSEHLGTPAITVAAAQPGVRYDLVIGAVPDSGFARDRADARPAVTIDADGTPVRVVVPVPGDRWRSIPGHGETGASGTGRGTDLAIRTPPLAADGTVVVRAVKSHGEGTAAYETAVPLSTPVAALVRPAPNPPLRIEATIVAGELRGLRLRGGQPGVYYAVAAAGEALGTLYVHQLDPADVARNKGVGGLAIGIDLAVAADLATAAPPPVPRLDTARALPLTLSFEARRATTGLRRALAVDVPLAAPPRIAVTPERVAAGGAATVTVEPPPRGATAQLLVDGEPRGAPAVGGSDRIVLATGPLAAGARVELRLVDPAVGGVEVTRRVAVPVRAG